MLTEEPIFMNLNEEELLDSEHLSCSLPDWIFEDFKSPEYVAEVDKVLS